MSNVVSIHAKQIEAHNQIINLLQQYHNLNQPAMLAYFENPNAPDPTFNQRNAYLDQASALALSTFNIDVRFLPAYQKVFGFPFPNFEKTKVPKIPSYLL